MKKILIVLAIIAALFWYMDSQRPLKNILELPQNIVPAQSHNTSTIANPASVNCTKQGGTLTTQKRGDGGEYALCNFANNRSCEEWALFRGECPKGGVKTSGLDALAQKYCAWVGGQTIAVENAECTFKNGKTCGDEALYNGTCSSK